VILPGGPSDCRTARLSGERLLPRLLLRCGTDLVMLPPCFLAQWHLGDMQDLQGLKQEFQVQCPLNDFCQAARSELSPECHPFAE
jgi:hypothetical protein